VVLCESCLHVFYSVVVPFVVTEESYHSEYCSHSFSAIHNTNTWRGSAVVRASDCDL